MKLLLCVLASLALAAAEPMRFYHSAYGIEEAARIKQREAALDFDGNRIAGGSNAAAGAQPHLGGLLITLTSNQGSVCGSSLLTNTRSVTAAHCWWDGRNQAASFTLVFGTALLYSGGTRVTTNQVTTHNNWNPNNLNNDVAVISHSHVSYSSVISNIALATGSNNYAGTWAWAAGFGTTPAAITINQSKKHVQVQVITNAVCQNTFGSSIVASTICVATTGGNSPCPGDSGGPLAIGSGSSRQLIGIVSFGHILGCNRGLPAAFARVTSFASWIQARL